MEDFIFTVQQLERFPVMVACMFVAIAFGLIREVTQSGGLALIAAPLLMIGSLASHYLFTVNSIILVNDKDTNVVAGVAIGLLLTFILLMLTYWMTMLLSERRSANKQLKPLAGLPRGSK